MAKPSPSSAPDLVAKACKEYFSQKFIPVDELKAQFKRMGKAETDVDWEKVEGYDTLYTSSMFDLCEWWKSEGRKRFPLIFLILPSVLSVPASNAFQERIFSCCTYFDNPLRQSLKDGRFEMAVLLAVNQNILRKGKVSEEEVEKIVDNVMKQFEGETGLDPTAEDFVVVDSEDSNDDTDDISFDQFIA